MSDRAADGPIALLVAFFVGVIGVITSSTWGLNESSAAVVGLTISLPVFSAILIARLSSSSGSMSAWQRGRATLSRCISLTSLFGRYLSNLLGPLESTMPAARHPIRVLSGTAWLASAIALWVTQDFGWVLLNTVSVFAFFHNYLFSLVFVLGGYLVKRRRIIGKARIYKETLRLIDDASESIVLYSPVVAFGAWSLGMHIFQSMVEALEEQVKRGRQVRILCDCFDSKERACLKTLASTGAEIRCRKQPDPWRYFLIVDGKKALRLYSEPPCKGRDGQTYRPVRNFAHIVTSSGEIREMLDEFDVDWEELGVPSVLWLDRGLKKRMTNTKSLTSKKVV